MPTTRWNTLAMGIVSVIIFDNILSSPSRGTIMAKNDDTVCKTEECEEIARTINQNMKAQIDPCEDFYEFACGCYRQRTNKVGVGSFDEIRRITYGQLKSIITDGHHSNFPPLRMAYDFYQSCTADETAKKVGVRPIYDKLLELGKWPLTKTDKNASWLEIMRKSRNLGFFPDYIVSITVLINPHNNSEILIAIIPPSLPLPTSILQQGPFDPTAKKYFEFMMLIGVEFEALSSKGHLTSSITDSLKEIEKLFFFEVQLAKISPLVVQAEDLLSLEILTLKKLKQQYPLTNWNEVLQSIIGAGVKLNDSEKTTVIFPKFMVELEHLLKATPESFSEVIGSRYVGKYFHEDSRKGVEELVRQIQGEVKNSLLRSSWMDNKTKEQAIDKLEAVVAFVGYADDLLHRDTEMIKAYGNVHIDVTNHYESFLNVSKLIYDQEISRLRQVSHNKVSHSISPASINAFYVPTENTIVIPAAILQNLFYSVNRPNYLNFGTIGYVTGHELSHAFDNYGSHFDKFGHLKNWWQPETEMKYKDRIKCFVDQYSDYYLEEIDQYVNGYLTLGENLADNEGIKTAYKAYKSWQSTHQQEQRLPGLNYTPEQLFWISSANAWCAKYSPTFLNLMVQTDSHAPSMIRVNGQLANQKEFAKDFACPVGSKMNPRKKCQFW